LALLVEGFYFGFVQVVFLADCPRQTAEESLEITDARCGVFIITHQSVGGTKCNGVNISSLGFRT
jgi:hypothetical protein